MIEASMGNPIVALKVVPIEPIAILKSSLIEVVIGPKLLANRGRARPIHAI